jgi:hypothetical protein
MRRNKYGRRPPVMTLVKRTEPDTQGWRIPLAQ